MDGKLASMVSRHLKLLGKIRLITIDNWIFACHYRCTTWFLISCSALLGFTQFFGKPILCIKSERFIEQKVVDTYCWTEGTFTLVKALNKKVGEEIPHLGIDRYKTGDEIIKHKYYQWVCWLLFLQALSFYFPRLLWKVWEGGRIKMLSSKLNNCIISEDLRKKACNSIVEIILEPQRKIERQNYAVKFFICEIINLLNVCFQMFMINKFVNGEFISYGRDVLKFMYEEDSLRVDPMSKIFPKMTKCIFHAYGSSGDVQKFDNLCILPLNIFNEKIFVFLWFWFILLVILSSFSVINRLACMKSKKIRYYNMRLFNSLITYSLYSKIVKKLNYGDWFIFYLLSKNMNPAHYSYLLELFASKLDKDTSIELSSFSTSTSNISSEGTSAMYFVDKHLHYDEKSKNYY